MFIRSTQQFDGLVVNVRIVQLLYALSVQSDFCLTNSFKDVTVVDFIYHV